MYIWTLEVVCSFQGTGGVLLSGLRAGQEGTGTHQQHLLPRFPGLDGCGSGLHRSGGASFIPQACIVRGWGWGLEEESGCKVFGGGVGREEL